MKHRYSWTLMIIWIFAWMFFYILRQNQASAQRELESKTTDVDIENINLKNSFQQLIVDSKKKFDNTFDIEKDWSIQRYLDDNNPFLDTNYVPSDLQAIESHFTYNKSKQFKLRSSAAIAFADMAWWFWDHFDRKAKFFIVSAYRSFWHQKYLNNKWCKKTECAEAGSSEHQAWLAIDLSVAMNWKILQMHTWSDFYKWMDENAHKYWFHNTYQKWVEIDGKIAEHRHWRYLWVPFARYLHDNNMTIAEYFKTKN